MKTQQRTAGKKAIHVGPTRDGRWYVKTAGNEKRHRIVDTMGEAIVIGRRIAMNRGTELIVHRTDGSIRSKDSFGVDPFPPR